MKTESCRARAPLRLFVLTALIGLSGCGRLPASESPVATIAVLINSRWVEDDPRGFVWEVRRKETDMEERFADCVRRSSAAVGLPVRVITGTQFRATAFPDLDPRAAPGDMEALRSLIPDPRFRARIDAAQIDYLAVVGGEPRSSELKGGIWCVGGYMAAACFGQLWRDHDAKLSALLIDLRWSAQSHTREIDASDTSWFAMLGVLPIGAPSAHEAMACSRFGGAIIEAVGEMRRGRQ